MCPFGILHKNNPANTGEPVVGAQPCARVEEPQHALSSFLKKDSFLSNNRGRAASPCCPSELPPARPTPKAHVASHFFTTLILKISDFYNIILNTE